MVDSEDNTVEKTKTQEFFLENNTLSDTFQQSTSIKETPQKSPQKQAVNPNTNPKAHPKKF